MEKPAPRLRAASAFLPAIATASTDSTRRTASRCARPMKPVPKIAVLIAFIFFFRFLMPCALGPPSGRRLLTNNDAVEEVRSLGQSFFRREQTVFMLDREHVIIAKHTQGRNQFSPPLGAVTVAAGTEDPAAVPLLGIWLGIEHAGARQIHGVELRVLGMYVKDSAFQYAHGGDGIDTLPEEMAGIEIATHVRPRDRT